MFGIGLEQKYFNLTEIFVLRLFKMVTNKTECSKLEQRSVIKFLVAEKCKPYEIYKSMYVYSEEYFSRKNVYKWVKYVFATKSLS